MDREADAPHSIDKESPIKTLLCSCCAHKVPVDNLGIKNGGHFSNLKCKVCNEVCSTKRWLCECGIKWTKCSEHFIPKPPERHRLNQGKRKADFCGVDHPLPKRPIAKFQVPVQVDFEPRRILALPPGSKLARRFPHHVQGFTPT